MIYEDEEDGLSPKERAIKELMERRSPNDLNMLLVNKLKDMRAEKENPHGRHLNMPRM